MRFLVFLFLTCSVLIYADEAKEARRAQKEEARHNHQIAKQAAKDRKLLEKQRLKHAKEAAKASHHR